MLLSSFFFVLQGQSPAPRVKRLINFSESTNANGTTKEPCGSTRCDSRRLNGAHVADGPALTLNVLLNETYRTDLQEYECCTLRI